MDKEFFIKVRIKNADSEAFNRQGITALQELCKVMFNGNFPIDGNVGSYDVHCDVGTVPDNDEKFSCSDGLAEFFIEEVNNEEASEEAATLNSAVGSWKQYPKDILLQNMQTWLDIDNTNEDDIVEMEEELKTLVGKYGGETLLINFDL